MERSPTSGADGATRLAPLTSPDRIEALVHAICAVGPRPQGAPGHTHARRVILDALEEVEAAPYRGHDLAIRASDGSSNVLAVVPGSDRHRRPLLLATHYDGPAGSPGAGDNAAAVAVLLTLLPLLGERRFERDVIVAFLDGGDRTSFDTPRANGLTRFLDEQLRHDLKAALVVDRIGHAVDATRAPQLLVVGSESETRLPELLASLRPSLPTVAPLERRSLRTIAAADTLHRHGVPYLWLSGGATDWHRSVDDTPERLDPGMLDASVPLLLALLDRLSRARLPGPFGEHDIAAYRQQAWRRWPDPASLTNAQVRLGGAAD